MLSVPENVRSSHSNLPADKQRIFAFPVRFEKEENTIMHGLSGSIMVFFRYYKMVSESCAAILVP